MIEYALVDPGDLIVRYAVNVDPTVETKAGWRWLPVERSTEPLGPAQVYEAEVITVLADKVTVFTAARDRTPAETDADRSRVVDRLGQLLLAALLDHENRLRRNEPHADPVDAAGFRAILKAMVS